MSEIRGGCFCGEIRYCIRQITGSGMCYCANCRKVVGGHSVAWVDSQQSAVDLPTGQPARYAAPNGAVWSFCANCGSTLFWESGDGSIAITTGTLDDPAAFPPENSSWDEERLPWEAPFSK